MLLELSVAASFELAHDAQHGKLEAFSSAFVGVVSRGSSRLDAKMSAYTIGFRAGHLKVSYCLGGM